MTMLYVITSGRYPEILGRWRLNGIGKNASMFARNQPATRVSDAAGIQEVLWAPL